MTLSKAYTTMASVSNELNPVLKSLLYAVCIILAGIVGWVMVDGIDTDREHGQRITALESSNATILVEINRRLAAIEAELRGR